MRCHLCMAQGSIEGGRCLRASYSILRYSQPTPDAIHKGALLPPGPPRELGKKQNSGSCTLNSHLPFVPFGVTYEKIGTIQRRLAWPLHKDDTLSRSGRPTGLNIFFFPFDKTSIRRASQ